eukprot:s1597_g2.t3
MVSVWLYGREPWPEAPVVLVTDEREHLAKNSANLCMEMSGCPTAAIQESYPEEIQEALDLEESLAGLQWVFVTLDGRQAIGVGSKKKQYIRASRLGLALAHLTREGEVKKGRVRLCGLLETFQNARPLGDGCDDTQHDLCAAMAALKEAEAPAPEPDPDPDLDPDPLDPWEQIPDWACGGSAVTTPLSISAVESCRIRGESFSTQVVCRILHLSTQNMLRLLRQSQGRVARINLNGRPWHKVVAGTPDHVREMLVGCGIHSCHLEVDEATRSDSPPYSPVPFFSFTRVDGSKGWYRPSDAAPQVAPISPRAANVRSPPPPPRNQQRPGRSRSRERQRPAAATPLINWREREGPPRRPAGPPKPVRRVGPSSIYAGWGNQPETQEDEWEVVSIEEENDQPLSIQREPQVQSGPIGASPDLLARLCEDRRLGAPQRELLHQAVQCNGRLLRSLDPAICPEAEWIWKPLWLDLDDARLKCGHATISRRFGHGQHTGQPVQQLVVDLQMGRLKPQQLPALVAVASRGDIFVVCGNRRCFAVKEFAKSTPPWKRPYCWVRVIVHDFPQLPQIGDPAQRMAFALKAIQAVDGDRAGPRMR